MDETGMDFSGLSVEPFDTITLADGKVSKETLLGVKPPALRPREGTLAHINRPTRGPRKKKPPPAEEHEPDIGKTLAAIVKEEPLNIVPDEPSVVVDEALIAADEEDRLQEEAQVTQELETALSPFTQRRPASSSGSPEVKHSKVEDMVFHIHNSRRFDDVLHRQWYYRWV